MGGLCPGLHDDVDQPLPWLLPIVTGQGRISLQVAVRLSAEVRTRGALAGTPRLAGICIAAAGCYFVVGQWDDALAALETAAGIPSDDVKDPVVLHGLVALIAAHRDDWDTVEEHLAAAPDQVLDSAQHRMAAYDLLLARAGRRAGGPPR